MPCVQWKNTFLHDGCSTHTNMHTSYDFDFWGSFTDVKQFYLPLETILHREIEHTHIFILNLTTPTAFEKSENNV